MNISKYNYGQTIKDNANTIAVIIGDLTIFFSYGTIISFSIKGELTVRKNEWGSTTGKHLNWIDGGTKESRIDGVEFLVKLSKAIEENI